MDDNHRYTLSDVWYAIRFHRNFQYAFWMDVLIGIIAESLLRYAGLFLSAMAILLISVIGYASFFIILPVVATPGSIWYAWNLVFGIYLLCSVLYNYIAAVFTSPGIPTRHDNIDSHSSSSMDNCKKCSLPRPPRTHHCSICKVCVLKMDHHCPWINNCVGKRNYRFFVGFLFTVTLATTYLCCILACPMYKVMLKKDHPVVPVVADSVATRPSIESPSAANLIGKEAPVGQSGQTLSWLYGRLGFAVMAITPATLEKASGVASSDVGEKVEKTSKETIYSMLQTLRVKLRAEGVAVVDYVVVMLFVVSAAVASAVSVLLGFHSYLVLTAQTTIEFYENISVRDKMRRSGRIYFNPYDKGLHHNLSQVFGGHRHWLASLMLPWLSGEEEHVSSADRFPPALLV